MLVKINQYFWKRNSIVIDGEPRKVGFDVQFTVELPFVPVVGLRINVPTKAPGYEPFEVAIEQVIWDVSTGSFTCYAEDYVGYEVSADVAGGGGVRAASLAASYEELRLEAAILEADGWSVDRRCLFEGQWRDEAGELIRPIPESLADALARRETAFAADMRWLGIETAGTPFSDDKGQATGCSTSDGRNNGADSSAGRPPFDVTPIAPVIFDLGSGVLVKQDVPVDEWGNCTLTCFTCGRAFKAAHALNHCAACISAEFVHQEGLREGAAS